MKIPEKIITEAANNIAFCEPHHTNCLQDNINETCCGFNANNLPRPHAQPFKLHFDGDK